MSRITFLFLVFSFGFVSIAAAQAPAPAIERFDVAYAIPGLNNAGTREINGTLRLQAGPRPLPAVVLLHGSSGIDGRGVYHGNALNAAWIATLEIEMFARGGRPTGLSATVPHAIGALNFLADRPDIDPAKIGAMGFSWGGGLSLVMLTARAVRQADHPNRAFAAHVAFYPVCWPFTPEAQNRGRGIPMGLLTGAPILVLAGEKDDYDQPDSCLKFHASVHEDYRSKITVHVFPSATHKWDAGVDETMEDPNAYLGRGGRVTVRSNSRVTEESRQVSVDFFRRVFALDQK